MTQGAFHKLATAAALTLIVAGLTAGVPAILHAAEAASDLTYRNGHFEPAALSVPAGVRVKLKVTNASDSAIEFESFELNRERVVPPGGTITVYLPSLGPGAYHFFDDFHREAGGQGTITAR
jgi:plastocyanin